MEWKQLKVLVTGGAGMIGSNLVAAIVGKGAVVTVADNLWRGKLENLNRDGKPVVDLDKQFMECDLVDYDNCLKAVKGQDVIYHLADVVAGINYVFGNQFSLFHENILMNTNVLHAAIASKVPRFVYVGSACSFPLERQNRIGGPLLKESDTYPAHPESSYGWSKLMGEYECELAAKEGLMDVGILRFHNVYGPNCEMSPELSQVIPALIRKALRYPEEDFVVWGSGRQRRAFVYVDDIIDALISVLEKGMGAGCIQIGPDTSTSIREIAEYVVKISGKDIPVEYDTGMREGDVDRAADYSKARAVLGWEPKIDIETGLRKTYEWCEQKLAKE